MITFEQLINRNNNFYLLYIPYDLSVPRQLVPIRVRYKSSENNYRKITFVSCDDLPFTHTFITAKPTKIPSFKELKPQPLLTMYTEDWENGRPSGYIYLTQDKIFLKHIIRDIYRILQDKSMTKTAPMAYKRAIQGLKNLKPIDSKLK